MRSYKSIPGVDEGETCLTLYEPGEWFNKQYYVIFVGGGYGKRHTLPDAEAWLLSSAIEYCSERIAEAQRTMDHYILQRDRLKRDGLECVKSEKKK